MSWIEGIGDEVTVLLTVLLVSVIICVAWLSTGITDIPFIRVIVIQLRQRRRQQVAAQEETNDPLIRRHTDEIESDSSVSEETIGQANVNNDDNSVTGEQVVPHIPGEAIDVQSTVQREQTSERVQTKTSEDQRVKDNVNVTDVVNDGSEDTTLADRENLENDRIDTENSVESLPSPELRHRRLMFFHGAKTHSDESEPRLETPAQNETENCENCNNTHASQSDEAENSQNVPHNSTDCHQPDPSSLISEQTGTHHSSSTNVTSETETENQTETRNSSETSGEIHVKLKYLNDTQRLVTTSPTETIGSFRQKHFSSELSESKLVRFIFNGHDLRNDASTLQACNIMDNSVVHCLVTQPRQPATNNNNNQDENLFDIGIFMLPLFGILLGIVWYMRFMYRQFFNVTSTLTLCGITFLYVAAFMSTLRGRRPHEHLE